MAEWEPGMWEPSDFWGGEADTANEVAQSNEKPVPVEVKMVVWVKREAWIQEYGGRVEFGDKLDFEEAIQDWARAEVQEAMVEQGNWPNVTEVTE